MNRRSADILVAGGGLAGLIAAAAFSSAGYRIVLAEPGHPVTKANQDGADLRSTAFLLPAQNLFERIGLWPVLEPHAVALETLRIVDTTGSPPHLRGERAFCAPDVGDQPFGWNFLNWLIRRELLAHLEKQPNVTLEFGSGVRDILTRTSGAIATLANGSTLAASLVIAADGRNSAVRDIAGIGVKTTRYGQKSLAFVATHATPHNNVSTEIYNEGGPFTMVPLADVDGNPASAIVWMNKGRRALDLLALGEAPFNAAMTERAAGLFGPMKLASKRTIWPIITQTADRLTGERIAIIAEAAHVLPPIGAQGLNTSLNDIAALLDAASKHPSALGGPAMLKAYAATRRRDIANRAHAIDLFNRVTRSGSAGLQSLRLTGLQAAHDIAPLRRGLMRAGMGPM